MNKFLIYLFVLAITWGSSYAQTAALKSLKPKIGPVPDLSEKAQQEFKRFNELNSKENKTPQESAELDTLFTKYNPTTESLYDIIGGGDSWYNDGGPYQVKASSELAPSGGATYTAKNAQDLSLKTVWCEGKPGLGTGEYLEYSFKNASPRVTTVMIYNGYVKREDLWKKNSRVKKMKLLINGQPYAILNLSDTRALQSFDIGVQGRRKDGKDLVLKFEIMEAYKGEKYEDVVITEIYFDGLDVLCFPAGAQVSMADGTFKGIENIKEGDLVWSYDINNKTLVSSEVLEIGLSEHTNFVKITFEDNSAIVSTPDHPYLKSNGNWAAVAADRALTSYSYTSIEKINMGDELLIRKGSEVKAVKILKIESFKKKQVSYTIMKLSIGKSFIVNDVIVGAEELREFIVKTPQGKSARKIFKKCPPSGM